MEDIRFLLPCPESSRVMVVHRPAPKRNQIDEVGLVDNILLCNRIVTNIPSRLTLPRKEPNPVQIEILVLLLLTRIILQVIPHAIGKFQQIITDYLSVSNGILCPPKFHIPEVLCRIGKIRDTLMQ